MQGRFPIMQENQFTEQIGISRHCSTIIHSNQILIMINNLSYLWFIKKKRELLRNCSFSWHVSYNYTTEQFYRIHYSAGKDLDFLNIAHEQESLPSDPCSMACAKRVGGCKPIHNGCVPISQKTPL